MAARDYRKGGVPYRFIAIPVDVIRSPDYLALPAASKVLMIDLATQYSGKNNGRLCPGFEVMRRCGWKHKGTLQRAKQALLECSFTVQTRIGYPPRTCEWIGFTWWRLDYHESMLVKTQNWPYLNFAIKSVVPKAHSLTPKTAPSGAKTVPMKAIAGGLSVPKLHHAT